MKVILINRKHGGSRSIELGRWSRALLSLCCLGLPLGMLAAGYLAGQESETRSLRGATLGNLEDSLASQAEQLAVLRSQAESKLQGMTLTLAEFQARMTRLDALGEHMTAMASLDGGEFDFSQPPAVGGPIGSEFNVDFQEFDVVAELGAFERRLSDREQQLEILESLLTNRNLEKQSWLSGRPAEKGWISSFFGQRTDPFTGKLAIHKRMDFAGKEGSEIIAVAGGVVTWAGERYGYGHLVEINHGNGYTTRYGHNAKLLVEMGDSVEKGQTISLMGSTGRSTGPHVHFEVLKNDRQVNPEKFVALR